MNSCVLMAKIIRNPELRYTSENQTAIANLMVEFHGQRPEDNYTLRVTGWGTLATEINEKYKEGDQVIIEGRLTITSYDRPEGFKEKRVELVASRLYRLDAAFEATSSEDSPTPSSSDKVVSFDDYNKAKTSNEGDPVRYPDTTTPANTQIDEDDPIPF